MATRLALLAHRGLFLTALITMMALAPIMGLAAPYAALVMDARTGEVLHAANADTRLHPASLTKMMTLYIAFEAVERGEISLETRVTISKLAASEPPSKLGLKPGQKIALKYLIRAAAVKSANDAATAIGEAIEGSEAAFARRMNRTAQALGMTRTTFKNANGLTEAGHLSTARDMAVLGRRLFYDFPQYYNIFSRRTADAGMSQVSNTNTRFLNSYKGADGIKTGYTSAAGFNLVGSAQRGNKRVIASVFGGRSTASRNAKMAELLDMGFGRAPGKATIQKPAAPDYSGADMLLSDAGPEAGVPNDPMAKGKTIRLMTAVTRSPRPLPRPVAPAAPSEDLLLAMQDGISSALAEVQDTNAASAPEVLAMAEAEPNTPAATPAAIPAATPDQLAEAAAEAVAAATAEAGAERVRESLIQPKARPAAIAALATPAVDPVTVADAAAGDASALVTASLIQPKARPAAIAALAPPATDALPDDGASLISDADAEAILAAVSAAALEPEATTSDIAALPDASVEEASPTAEAGTEPFAVATLAGPPARPAQMIFASAAPQDTAIAEQDLEVVTRVSSSGGRHFGVTLGRFDTRYDAERVLLQTAFVEMNTLGDARPKIVQRGGGFDANFVGLSQETAELACRRLVARSRDCTPITP